MVAADHDRCRDPARGDHVVEAHADPGPLAEAQPADPGREALKGDPVGRQADPPVQRLVVGELLEDGPVGGADVGRVAGQRRPAEGTFALAEERADVGGHEARVVERPVHAGQPGLGPQAVAVVEHLGAPVEQGQHGGHVAGMVSRARLM